MSANLKGKNENNLIGSQLGDQGCVNRYKLVFLQRSCLLTVSLFSKVSKLNFFEMRFLFELEQCMYCLLLGKLLGLILATTSPSPFFPSAYLVLKKTKTEFPNRLSVKNCKEGLKH